ncbi:pyridoxamine 5'-phosphate oxidase family protein [Bacillus sp. 31A1R]|uniref:Pyridoxamine 5'-phosphate oxidase family protein n=1 Tax=Robertmurraya mangrovi TaxID=3098077 RepID=A0ABU5J495_9BACI|nr:pyridoxamine 5'-phosphate oxidase family protein [Bacillus sp. 31A1R]MDZ5474197.1 pyridoxamine 5'-phosphate oxidase family protein [Bacillus sp. 31A1R]
MVEVNFKQIVQSEEELRELLGFPSETVKNKSINFLDEHCKHFIQKSPFLMLGTSDKDGNCDTSPRGDHPGFVLIADDQHMIIPERPGNRRMDSLRNILSNPQVGLIFMIPGLEETLRINGTAKITKDEELLLKMTAFGKTPQLGIVVKVEECYLHCAKAFKRSKLWNPESWLEQEELPHPAKILADHVNLPGVDEKQISVVLEDSYKNRLY